jgi:NADH dehydrogenase
MDGSIQRSPEVQPDLVSTGSRRPSVVIIGAGFGGLSAAAGLRRADADVTVIDRRNHHLFQLLLYQVATAALSPADIAAPIRHILARQANASLILGTVSGIDVAAREVLIHNRRLSYDQLVIATGAPESYFGHDEWATVTLGLKTIDDATTMRRRILAFERAEDSDDEEERRRLLTFVIIGGGPTGVELAGALAELAKAALARDFRRIDPTTARTVLIEAGPRLLPSFPAHLPDVAERALSRLDVEMRLDTKVSGCDDRGATLDGGRIESRTLIWAAGVVASPAAEWLGILPGRGGRVPVSPDLTVPGHPEIFVIGDTAHVEGSRGPLPGVAPVAKQEGTYVARVIAARLVSRPGTAAVPLPRSWQSGDDRAPRGSGRSRLAEVDRPLAWLFWSVAHIYFLIGFRNRMAVALDWLWSYLTYQRGARLITGDVLPTVPKP